jgi:MFS family permease
MTIASRIKARYAGLAIADPGSFWRLTGVLFLVYFATGTWSPLLSVYVKDLGAGTRDIGLVLGTFQLTSLLSQFWWGRWSDRIGRRKPLVLIGTTGMALAYVGIALSREWTWFYPIRMLEGVALAAYSTGSLAMIGDLLEDQRGRGKLMGLYRTFGSLAFSLAALTGGVIADNIGIRVPFMVAAICYGLAFLLTMQVKERRVRRATAFAEVAAPAAAPVATPSYEPSKRGVWAFLGMVFLWTSAMGSVVFLWPVYMESVGYSRTAVGSLWALAAMGEVPCFVIAGYLADRWGRKRVLIMGMVLMACVYLGYTISTNLLWLIVVQLVRSLAYASYEAPALLYTTEMGLRQQRGRLASLFYAASGGGGITGSVVGGAVAQETSLVTMYRGVVVIVLVGVLATGRMLPRLRQVQAQAPAPDQPVGEPIAQAKGTPS